MQQAVGVLNVDGRTCTAVLVPEINNGWLS